MGKKMRRQFTPEFKAETVRLVRESGKTVGQVSRDLGLTETAVRRWVDQSKATPSAAAIGLLSVDERSELERLRAEVRTLRMERDILKKATAFFAKENA